jgi:hypothetical protein
MKATLTFNLPEERVQYEYTLNAARYKDALEDMMEKIRYEIAWGNNIPSVHEKLIELYDRFGDITEGLLDE